MRGVLMYCFNRVVSHVLAETHVFAEVMGPPSFKIVGQQV